MSSFQIPQKTLLNTLGVAFGLAIGGFIFGTFGAADADPMHQQQAQMSDPAVYNLASMMSPILAGTYSGPSLLTFSPPAAPQGFQVNWDPNSGAPLPGSTGGVYDLTPTFTNPCTISDTFPAYISCSSTPTWAGINMDAVKMKAPESDGGTMVSLDRPSHAASIGF